MPYPRRSAPTFLALLWLSATLPAWAQDGEPPRKTQGSTPACAPYAFTRALQHQADLVTPLRLSPDALYLFIQACGEPRFSTQTVYPRWFGGTSHGTAMDFVQHYGIPSFGGADPAPDPSAFDFDGVCARLEEPATAFYRFATVIPDHAPYTAESIPKLLEEVPPRARSKWVRLVSVHNDYLRDEATHVLTHEPRAFGERHFIGLYGYHREADRILLHVDDSNYPDLSYMEAGTFVRAYLGVSLSVKGIARVPESAGSRAEYLQACAELGRKNREAIPGQTASLEAARVETPHLNPHTYADETYRSHAVRKDDAWLRNVLHRAMAELKPEVSLTYFEALIDRRPVTFQRKVLASTCGEKAADSPEAHSVCLHLATFPATAAAFSQAFTPQKTQSWIVDRYAPDAALVSWPALPAIVDILDRGGVPWGEADRATVLRIVGTQDDLIPAHFTDGPGRPVSPLHARLVAGLGEAELQRAIALPLARFLSRPDANSPHDFIGALHLAVRMVGARSTIRAALPADFARIVEHNIKSDFYTDAFRNEVRALARELLNN